MKQYLKAEFLLYKKQKGNIIIGCCGLIVYVLLLLFSGVGGTYYNLSTSIVGYVVFLFFSIAMYLSPASYWIERRKVVVTSEQLVLTLGESKRTYWKIRMVAYIAFYLGFVGLISLLQIPAALIAGASYQIWNYVLELVVFTCVVFLFIPVLFLVPAKAFLLAIPAWSGFCGGFCGGMLSRTRQLSKQQATYKFLPFMIGAFVVGLLCIMYRYWRIGCEERGGIRRKKH